MLHWPLFASRTKLDSTRKRSGSGATWKSQGTSFCPGQSGQNPAPPALAAAVGAAVPGPGAPAPGRRWAWSGTCPRLSGPWSSTWTSPATVPKGVHGPLTHPIWDIPSRRSKRAAPLLQRPGSSTATNGTGGWAAPAGTVRGSRNGFVVIWDAVALADMLACRSDVSGQPRGPSSFPAAALGARTQQPQDWRLRTPPPRREKAERRRPSQSPLPGIDVPRRPQEPQETGRPAEWVLREPPGHLRAARAPKGDVPGERNQQSVRRR